MKTLAILLMLASPALAQQAKVDMAYIDFSGGLNNYKASVYLDKNESPDLLNVVIDEPLGTLSQRNGYTACGSIPSGLTATNLYEYAKTNGSKLLIVTDNATIWQTADCVNFSTITTGLNSLGTPRFATIIDKLWITNGYDYPMTWDGATLTTLNGESELPSVPKGKYIAWWKDRVWLGNIAGDQSAVYFSAVASPDGTILNPATSSEAWTNANNVVYFNRGDGSQLHGLKVYRDNLYAFKETGISRLLFQSEFNVNVVKNVTTTGCKFQESIVEMDDGYLRFVGRDGVYRFDGSTVERISTKWNNTFKTFQQPDGQQANYHTWNTAAGWAQGTASGLFSAVDKPNSLSMRTGGWTTGLNFGFELNDATNWDTLDGYALASDVKAFGSYSLKTTLQNWTDSYPGVAITVKDNLGNTLATNSVNANIGSWAYRWVTWSPALATSSVYIWFTYSVDTGPGTTVTKTIKYGPVMTGAGDLFDNGGFVSGVKIYGYLGGASGARYTAIDVEEPSGETGASFESQDFKATNLSSWLTFVSNEAANGGTITHYIKTAPTQADLVDVAYATINSGIVVSTTTETWVKFKDTITTSDYNQVPEIISTDINWLTGTATKSLLSGINYKSRYWVAASTTPGGLYNDIMMVESKSPVASHTKFDLPVSAMTIWNGYLYGAIGNTAKIARLDYGNTDDGAAITSYWNSRDEIFDNPLAYKSINKVIADYASTPANPALEVALSPDFGVSYSTKTINTSLSGLSRYTTNVNFDANRELQFRSRVKNTQLGIGFRLYGLHPYGTASQFVGN